jgi:aminoglycoside 3-N-acetyltransferase
MTDQSTALIDDLRNLGVKSGDSLLVHSSFRSLGPMEDGMETLITALLKAIGKKGTLLMPALSYTSVNINNPLFDALHTPSCIGAVPEYFRMRAGTQRSLHPTHSVCAAGPKTTHYLDDHYRNSTPCGAGSAFRRLPDNEGKLLFIGCGLAPNTSMHAVEEVFCAPYIYGSYVDFQIIPPKGKTFSMEVRCHDFGRYKQRYDRVADIMVPPDITSGRLLAAKAYLLDAKAMWESVLTRGKEDPYFFVELKDDE